MATSTTTRVAASSRPVTRMPSTGDEPGDKSGKGGKDAAAGKKSKKKLMIIAIVVLVVAAGAYYFLAGKKPAKAGPPKPGAVVALEDNTVNLSGGHFLKIKIALQAVAGAPADLDTSKAADLMIAEFSGQPMSALSSAAGRAKLKEDLLQKIEAAYPHEIMGLYFTEFVMQ